MGNLQSSVQRQPPPPPPRRRRSDVSLMVGPMDPHLNIISTLMTNKEVGNKEMAGCKFLSVNRSYNYFRWPKKKRSTNIESLPDDLLIEILVRLPAQYIHNNATLVCRRWYTIIYTYSFVYTHLHHTTHGLLISCERQWGRRWNPIFITTQKGRIETSKFSNIKLRERVCSSCNGLILEHDIRNPKSLYIVNPATNRRSVLPLFPHQKLFLTFPGIAYVKASMEYKVAVMYNNLENGNLECKILSVGFEESWRSVHTEHLSRAVAEKQLHEYPLITDGFMHWATKGGGVLTLNVESEIIREDPVPRVYNGDDPKRRYYYMSTGKYLSLLIECKRFAWEVWEMEPETGEWTKLRFWIDLGAGKRVFKRLQPLAVLVPVGWLEYKEALVFALSYSGDRARACVAYNVCTEEMYFIELASNYKNFRFNLHRNSLVRLGGF